MRNPPKQPRSFIVSGASGLIGRELCRVLQQQSHRVKRLVRERPRLNSLSEIYWNPDSGHIESQALEGADAIIHLAGKPIAGLGRLTKKRQQAILESRVKSTELLAHAVSKLRNPPKLFLSASAVGYYGNRDDEVLTEQSAPGVGFLPEVCRAWEEATRPSKEAGVVVCHLRFGWVLSPDGGVLKPLLPLYRLGLPVSFGHPDQYVSWIALPDAINAILHLIEKGPSAEEVNVCSPYPVLAPEFFGTLAKTLNRRSPLHLSDCLLRPVLGTTGLSLLTDSTRAQPEGLLKSGFAFSYPHLATALGALLKI